MGQILACMITRRELLQSAVNAECEHLPETPDQLDGWGVGFFHAGEVLHKKRPVLNGERIRWQDALAGLQSRTAIAHLRQASAGAPGADNTHPFRMRQWLCAHHGSIRNFDSIKSNLRDQLPDFLRRNIRGQTDSEHLFHVILASLHTQGQLDANDPTPETVVAALRTTVQYLDELSSESNAPPHVINIALTNGRELYLTARGAPLYLVERDQPELETQHPDGRPVGPVRYVVALSCEGERTPSGYRAVPPGHAVHINRELVVTQHGLG